MKKTKQAKLQEITSVFKAKVTQGSEYLSTPDFTQRFPEISIIDSQENIIFGPRIFQPQVDAYIKEKLKWKSKPKIKANSL